MIRRIAGVCVWARVRACVHVCVQPSNNIINKNIRVSPQRSPYTCIRAYQGDVHLAACSDDLHVLSSFSLQIY